MMQDIISHLQDSNLGSQICPWPPPGSVAWLSLFPAHRYPPRPWRSPSTLVVFRITHPWAQVIRVPRVSFNVAVGPFVRHCILDDQKHTNDKTVLNKTYMENGKWKTQPKKIGEKIRLIISRAHLVSRPSCYPRKLPWFPSARVLVVVFHKFGQMTQSKP